MKKFVVRLVVSLCLLAAAGSTPALADGGAPMPICGDGTLCRPLAQASGVAGHPGK